MLLKVGINKKGINSNVDTYVFNETFLSSDVEMIQKKAEQFVSSIPEEYTEIELYQYDTDAISKMEFIEVLRAFITTDRKIVVYNIVYDQHSEEYIRHRIK